MPSFYTMEHRPKFVEKWSSKAIDVFKNNHNALEIVQPLGVRKNIIFFFLKIVCHNFHLRLSTTGLYKRISSLFTTYEQRTLSLLSICLAYLAYVVRMVSVWVTYILFARIHVINVEQVQN